jgi:hypothetical protein
MVRLTSNAVTTFGPEWRDVESSIGTVTNSMNTKPVLDVRVERRMKPRICKAFRVNVTGVNAGGEAFEAATVLDNLSSSGLYLRQKENVKEGAKIAVVIRLSTSIDEEARAAQVAVDGIVLRSDALPDGSWGLAVGIRSRRFI